MLKKKWATLAIAAIVAGSLSACAGDQERGGGGGAVQDDTRDEQSGGVGSGGVQEPVGVGRD